MKRIVIIVLSVLMILSLLPVGVLGAEQDTAKILTEAYALATGESLPYEATLTGQLTSIDYAYSADTNDITVTMVVEGKAFKCYRMTGDDVDKIKVGDTITVTGKIKNYNGTIEFDKPTLIVYVKSVEPIMGDVTGDGRLNMGDVAKLYAHIRNTAPLTDQTALDCADFTADGKINIGDTARIYAYIRGTDPAAVVDAAYQLAENQEMAKDSTLTGKVLSIIEPYNSKYGCITVSMGLAGREDYPIVCSRLMGADGANISVNDNITVTGRLRNFYGSIEFKEGCQLVKWENVLTAEELMAEIVDEAYGLRDNEVMDHPVTLTGKVVSIDQAYSASLPYISVTISVPGREDKPISCYRMVGEQIAIVKKDDIITVTGTLRNFYGTVEFIEGCQLESFAPGNAGVVAETDPIKIMADAKNLAENAELPYDVTLTGMVTAFEDVYDEEFQDVTVIIAVEGTSDSLKVYRMKGFDLEKLAICDVITVKGRIRNYYGIIEMVNCSMTRRVSGGGLPPVSQTDYQKIVDAAYALSANASLPYTATLKGKIVELQSSYDPNFRNMTVVIAVAGREDKPIVCYRMKGDNIGNHLCVGDTITVEGRIKNYVNSKGVSTIEFDAGCKMINRQAGSVTQLTDSKQIVDAAFALGENESLPYFATLTGTVKSIDEPYSTAYGYMTLTMTVQGTDGPKDIVCYRLKGNGADALKVGSTITVTGAIKHYVGDKNDVHVDNVEFNSGCFLES